MDLLHILSTWKYVPNAHHSKGSLQSQISHHPIRPYNHSCKYTKLTHIPMPYVLQSSQIHRMSNQPRSNHRWVLGKWRLGGSNHLRVDQSASIPLYCIALGSNKADWKTEPYWALLTFGLALVMDAEERQSKSNESMDWIGVCRVICIHGFRCSDLVPDSFGSWPFAISLCCCLQLVLHP